MKIPQPLVSIKDLRNGIEVKCPKCGKGRIVATGGNPKISHYFKCSECSFSVNLD